MWSSSDVEERGAEPPAAVSDRKILPATTGPSLEEVMTLSDSLSLSSYSSWLLVPPRLCVLTMFICVGAPVR